MKHLIICGPAGVGKTLLGNWIFVNTTSRVEIIDGVSAKFIKRTKIPKDMTCVFITNDHIDYSMVDKRKFLIINLTNEKNQTPNISGGGLRTETILLPVCPADGSQAKNP